MIHKTLDLLKSLRLCGMRIHKWLGIGPSISIYAVLAVGLVSILATPSAKLQVISPYSVNQSAITLGGGAILGDSSTIGEFRGAGSGVGSTVSALMDKGSYLNNGGISSARAEQNGITVTIKKGDNLSTIASTYNVSVSRLMSFNNIKSANKLRIGQVLAIPDVEKIKPVEKVPKYSLLPNISAFLSFPLRDNQNTFRYLNYDHVDILSPCGTTIYSSADGLVEHIGEPKEWNDGLGGNIVIQHAFSNSPKTYYAHTSKNLVSVGDLVEKGDPIAEVGNTGEADVQGCNLRFGVIGAQNPFAKYLD